MRKLSLILAITSLAAIACSSDEEFEQSASPLIINAEAENIASTRTVLSEDGRSIFWDVDDSLSVFLGGDIMNCAVVYGQPNGRSAKFIVDGKFIIGGTTDDNGTSYTNVALYPYDESATILDSDTLYTVFPAVQKAVINSIPNDVPMVAAVANVSTTSFTFKNVCSFIRLSLTSPTDVAISKIVLISDLKPLSGGVALNVFDAGSTVLGAGNNTITLNCDGISLSASPTVFFMALLPVTFSDNAWSVELFDDNGGTMKFVFPAFTFERNKYYTLNINYVPVE